MHITSVNITSILSPDETVNEVDVAELVSWVEHTGIAGLAKSVVTL